MRSFIKRKGLVLVGVLWLVIILTVIISTTGRSSRLDTKVTMSRLEELRCKWAGRAGVEKAFALFGEDDTEADSLTDVWSNNPTDMNDVMLDSCRVTIRVVDESGKLNVNTATRDQLLMLPDMTEDIADAIVDWRDSDDVPGDFGAEAGYYESLPYPYTPRNGDFRTIRELLLVKGVTEELLYGEDTNFNGKLDHNERDGDASPPNDDGDDELDPGWISYLTCYTGGSSSSGTSAQSSNSGSIIIGGSGTSDNSISSGSGSSSSSGTFSVTSGGNSSSSSGNSVISGGNSGNSSSSGNSVISGGSSNNNSSGNSSSGGRSSGSSSGGSSGFSGNSSSGGSSFSGNSGGSSSNFSGGSSSNNNSNNSNNNNNNSGGNSGGQNNSSGSGSQSQSGDTAGGMVNINTAPEYVLTALLGAEGISYDDAQVAARNIVNYRDQITDGLTDPSELVDGGAIDQDTYDRISSKLTTTSNVFTIYCTSVAQRGAVDGARMLTEAVVDRSQTPPKILYWYQGTGY